MKKAILKALPLLVIIGLVFIQCNKHTQDANARIISQWSITGISSSAEKIVQKEIATARYKLAFENKSLCGSSATRIVLDVDAQTIFEQVYPSGSDIEKTFTVPANSVLKINTSTVEGDKNIVCIWQGTSSFTLTRLP